MELHHKVRKPAKHKALTVVLEEEQRLMDDALWDDASLLFSEPEYSDHNPMDLGEFDDLS